MIGSMARGPNVRKVRRIAILGGGDGSASRVQTGIAAYARHHPQWELYPLWSADPRELRQLPHRADGILATVYNKDHIARCARFKTPLVNMVQLPDPSPLPLVCPDNRAGGALAARHLLDLGVRNLGAFGFTGTVGPDSTIRLSGFVEAADRAGVECSVTDIEYPYDWREVEAFWAQAGRWLTSLKLPVGILAFTDRLGARLAKAAQVAGLHVPDDVALVGYDNHETMCLCSAPPLSSVDPNHSRVGYEAAARLDRMIQGRDTDTAAQLIPPMRVAARASSDVIAHSDRLVALAIRFIRDHATQGITADQVYQAAHASRATLQPRFRKEVGHTVSEEIWRTRLRHARLLLLETDLPQAQVAADCGFTSLSHFSRRFRQETGQSPGQFRRNRSGPGGTQT
jgi:LacI family transcriptional regulator